MRKEKIRLEYMLKAGSGNIVWSIISTPSGLETWFRTQKVAWKHVFRLLSQQVTPSGNSRSASPLGDFDP